MKNFLKAVIAQSNRLLGLEIDADSTSEAELISQLEAIEPAAVMSSEAIAELVETTVNERISESLSEIDFSENESIQTVVNEAVTTHMSSEEFSTAVSESQEESMTEFEKRITANSKAINSLKVVKKKESNTTQSKGVQVPGEEGNEDDEEVVIEMSEMLS